MKLIFENIEEINNFVKTYSKEQFNYGKFAAIKPHTGDYLYTDGTFSAERDLNKELKGIVLWVTDSRMITLWPDVPDEQMTYSEAEKWCKDNGHKLLDKDAMLAIFINRDVLKDKINLKDDCDIGLKVLRRMMTVMNITDICISSRSSRVATTPTPITVRISVASSCRLGFYQFNYLTTLREI